MVDGVQPFRAIEISGLARRLSAEGRSVIHLEFGQPSAGAPIRAIEAARQSLLRGDMGYWESPELRGRLGQLYRQRYGLTISPDRFLMTCGASPALVLALSICFRPGDRIAMARPGYVAYRNTVRALNMTPVEIACGPSERFQLTAEMLDTLEPAPDGVIIASPANPTGTIIDARGLQAIAEVCKRRNIRVISDEIYHGLSYGEPCHSMLEYEPHAMVISSFSKYFCMPGWRLGWLLAAPDLIERARAYIGSMFLSAPAISQQVAFAALDCQTELDALVSVYAENRKRLVTALPQLGLSQIAPPDGAFYIYANIAHLSDDSMGFCKQLLLETGIAAGPGVDHDPVDGNHFMRLSFAVSTERIDDALSRLGPWLAAKAQAGFHEKPLVDGV
jgi:aspartate/methionine/tyrosine aminotransferase